MDGAYMSDTIVRMPPYSLEAEQSVLGSMMIDKEAIAAASEILTSDDFYSDGHKEIYNAILSMYEQGEPVDLITLTETLRQRGTLEGIGAAYITELSMVVPSTANVKYYIRIVEEKAILRRLIKASNDIIKDSYEAQQEVDIILDEAEKRIFKISERRSRADFEPIKVALLDAYAQIEELSKIKGK